MSWTSASVTCMEQKDYNDKWTTRAKCAGRDPLTYELDTFKGDKDMLARGLCLGCPVTRECAADALDPLAVGTVRAGTWIPEKSGTPRRRVRRRLAAVAREGLDAL